MEKELIKISNKARFIHEQIVEPPTIILRKRKAEVISMFKEKDYAVINGDEEYKYLRTMPIDSVEEENYNNLLKVREKKRQN